MKILVTGATGRVGRPLVEQLAVAGHQVRALTRNPAAANFPAGVEAVAGDLTNPASFAAALEGVEALHLINFDGGSYAPLQTGQEIVALAEAAGVKRVTVLRGGDETSVEAAVQASGMDWTFLNPVEFMSGALDYAEAVRRDGVVRMGFVDRKSAMVHDADIASVAASVLTSEGHGGKSYTITGSEVLTPRTMLDTIGKVIGRDIQLVELSEAEARAQWASEGFPPDVIEFFVMVHGSTPEIGYTVVPTVEQVTVRPPRTFAQWASENAAAFR
jgi:uncharacterized protein YbjT (DUF2867 family)